MKGSFVDYNEFKKSIADPSPVYFLKTDQDYLKKKVFELAREQVQEGARDFDWSVFDLERDSETDLANEARTLPWMSPRRWIFVRTASAAKGELAEILKNPPARTVLVLETDKTPPKSAKYPVIQMPARSDPVAWIVKRAAEEGVKIGKDAAETLLELVGEDYQRLDSELEKLILLNWESRRIDKESVAEFATQTQHYDIFALVGALAARRAEEALPILGRLFEEGMAAPQIVATLAWNFRRLLVARELMDQRRPFYTIVKELKLWSYKGREREIRATSKERLAQLLLLLREADRLCKTTGGDEKSLLERLVIDTCSGQNL